ncbi:MAG: hypothetical protein Q9201_000307 [Fulgogasparrea decipioides]
MAQTSSITNGNGPLPNGMRMATEELKPSSQPSSIAIIGMACRTPGKVSNPEHLWELCSQARSGWSEVPSSRFNHEAFYHPNPGKSGCLNSKGAHFLQDDIAQFDNSFFRISDKEASVSIYLPHSLCPDPSYSIRSVPSVSAIASVTDSENQSIDPQQRILLECAYEAIENASLAVDSLAGKDVGVFAAQSFSEYAAQLARDPETLPMFKATGCAEALMSNRISYAFDFRACQSLRAGEASMAIAGGCHLNLTPDDFISLSTSNLLSDHGKSMAFDHRATGGFGRGEGVGCVILKPLHTAIRDGDKIRAVIRNSGINQDGKTVGITMPSTDAQEALARSVYRSAGLDPLETQYVECHGTGTAVGDPIEVAALGAIFGRAANPRDSLYLGSIKSNIGHLEGASGVVAIIKAAMMLEKGFLLPNCNFQKPNPAIPFDTWNMKVLTKQIVWPRRKIRRASVNNFGFGGSNAHFILEQPPKIDRFTPENAVIAGRSVYQQQISEMIIPQAELGKSRRLIVLSASSEASVKTQAKNLAHYLKHRPEVLYRSIFSSLALTLQRRSLFQWRFAISATSQAGTFEALDKYDVVPLRSSREPKIGFVFTGQGAQWYAMGRELMHTYPVFLESLLYADDILTSCGCKWSLVGELLKSKDSSLLGSAYLAQPSCTAVQMALVNLLDSWNIKPVGVVGHSSGEIAAAYAAGAITFETGIQLAYHRGTAAAKLLQEFPGTKGAMLVIAGQESEVDSLLENHGAQDVVKACFNSPGSFTVSGDEIEIDRLDKAAKEVHMFSRKLQTEVAYHSHHMLLVADHYRSCIGEIVPKVSTKVGFHSSLLGLKANGCSLGTEYWVNNLISPVLFSEALESLCSSAADLEEHPDILIEVGPHTALKGPVRETLFHMTSSMAATPEYLPTFVRFEDSVATLFETAARLVMKGARLNLSAVNFPTKDPRQPTILTDMETYAWDHTNSHWHESRIAQGYRLRQGAKSDILGFPAEDFNNLEPRWRNVLRNEDLPWLEQHKVQGNIVYPMSGFIAMAVEAMKDRAKSRGLDVDRYLLREIRSSRSLIIPPDTEMETMVTLRPYSESAAVSSDNRNEFRILSWTANQGWSEHCRGVITLETTRPRPGKNDLVAEVVEKCMTDIKPSRLYNKLSKMGIQYGPLFTRINSLAAGRDCAMGTMTIPDTAATMPYQFESPHIIHPATLDSCFQFTWPMVIGPNLDLKALYVPVSIGSIAISNQVPKTPGTKLRVYGSQAHSQMPSKTMAASLFVEHHGFEEPAFTVEIDRLTLTRISEEQVWQRESKLAFKLEWKPDIDFISARQIQTLASSMPAVSGKLLEEPLILEQASLVFFRRALDRVPQNQISRMQPYLQKLYGWIVRVCELGNNSSALLQSQETLTTLTDDECLERASRLLGSRGELTRLMGENLPAILRGEIDPLSLLLTGDLLKDYYSSQDCIARSYQHACQYVDLIAHQNPALRILEIGAGTGGATYSILETLGGQEDKKPRFLSYDYTDISSGFFDAAKERFKPWNAFLYYRILDIEKEPSDQGFADAAYDIIIAANVLHATSILTSTMRRVRRLLKPGGKLVLIEETVPALRRFPFATLPGWWLSQEQDRLDGPLISEAQWDVVLRDTNFSGLDVCLQDYPGDPAHTSKAESRSHGTKILYTDLKSGSIILSTAQEKHQPKDTGDLIFVASSGEESTDIFPEDIESSFHETARLRFPKTCSIEEAVSLDLEKTTCIFLDHMENPVLSAMTDARLEHIKRLFQARGVIWVTRAAKSTSSEPSTGLISGLSRSLRSENAATKVVVLHSDGIDIKSLMDLILRIYRKAFLSNTSTSGEVDFEYVDHEGIIYVPRAHEYDEVEKTVVKHGRLPTPELQPFIQPGRPLTLKHNSAGMLSEFFFDDVTIAPPASLQEDKIKIEIKAMGVNFKDVMVALGNVEGYLGQDCSGIVAEIGNKVTNVSVGDRVCALGRDTFSNVLECSALDAVRIPEGMSLTDAASIPAVFCTAHYSLVAIARLQRGESVLIHGAAGGVGQAAIMISQMIGAQIYATVGSEAKKEHLIATYGLGSDHIFSSRSPLFGQQLREMTDGRGVDVVLNSLSGELLRTSWDCVAKYGRFVELGKSDIDRNSRLDMATFSKSTTFASVDLGMLREDKPVLMQTLLVEVMDLFRSGSIRNISPINVLPIDALGLALHDLQRGKTMGKTIIEPLPGQRVQVMPAFSSHPLIRPDATYLITGGMGGLGRSMTKWLVQQGAKSIALLSRSGHASAHAGLTNEYSAIDVNVSVMQCDVGDEDQVRKVMERCSQSMPPIRGVIHGAMVLHDKLFEQLSINEYEAIMRPKVQGAWNLHNALQKQDIDFFVTLASAAGILGTRGQAVYASTSTFLGAFARWRQAQNLPANTLYLGAVAEVGFVAENSDRQGAISTTYGDKGLTEREFLAFLRASIDNQHSTPELYTSLALGGGSTTANIYWASDAKFAHLRRAALASQGEGSNQSAASGDQAHRSLGQQLQSVDSLEAAQETISNRLKSKLYSLLMVEEGDIDMTKAVVTYGLDSLVAVEYRNWIAREAAASIQLLDLMTSKSFGELAALVTSKSALVDMKRFAQVNGSN